MYSKYDREEAKRQLTTLGTLTEEEVNKIVNTCEKQEEFENSTVTIDAVIKVLYADSAAGRKISDEEIDKLIKPRQTRQERRMAERRAKGANKNG